MRGSCGIGILDNKYEVNMGTLIRSARCLGADFAYTVGFRYRSQKSAVGHDQHFPIHDFDSVAGLKQANSEATLVGVEIDDRAEPLETYPHPEKAVYLLGAEDYGIPQPDLELCDDVVSIPSEYCLNVANTGAIVLYDRLLGRDTPMDIFQDIGDGIEGLEVDS